MTSSSLLQSMMAFGALTAIVSLAFRALRRIAMVVLALVVLAWPMQCSGTPTLPEVNVTYGKEK